MKVRMKKHVNVKHEIIIFHLADTYERTPFWYQIAIDRQHFRFRIAKLSPIISPILANQRTQQITLHSHWLTKQSHKM